MFPISNMDKVTLLGWILPPRTSYPHRPQGWRSGCGTFHFLVQTEPNSLGRLAVWVKPNSEVLQTDHLFHLSQTTGDIRVEALAVVVSGSQLHGWAWESPVFPSWLPGSSCNIIISQVLLVHPLWKKKRPLLGLCSLLEEQALRSLPRPGTAGRAVFPPHPK